MEPEFKPEQKVIFRSTDSGPEYQKPYDAVVNRLLTSDECDIQDVGYMYEIQFSDGTTKHAFEDELSVQQ